MEMDFEYKYTVEDLMRMLHVSGETVRRWCRSGRIKSIKLPGTKGKYRFTQQAIEEFLDSIGGNDMPVKEALFDKTKTKKNDE